MNLDSTTQNNKEILIEKRSLEKQTKSFDENEENLTQKEQQQQTTLNENNDEEITIEKKNQKKQIQFKQSPNCQNNIQNEFILSEQITGQQENSQQLNPNSSEEKTNEQNTQQNSDSNEKDELKEFDTMIKNKNKKTRVNMLSLKNKQKFLDAGGQAVIYSGQFQNKNGIKEDCVFKVYFEDMDDDQFKQEIEIMKNFENPINIVKILDSFEIEKYFILILEKCQYSLLDELKMFDGKKKKFSIDQLLKIIFDLFNGLIQFRIYNVLQLDIKPGNVLKSKGENFCYSDFGTSINKKKNQLATTMFTPKYAAPEQKNYNLKKIDFKSDVYCLGKTFISIFEVFKKVNEDYVNQKETVVKLISNLEEIIKQKMTSVKISNRLECHDLHNLFIKEFNFEEHKAFFNEYKQKIEQMSQLYSFDSNKDTPYFQQLKLFYNFTKLQIIIRSKNSDKNLLLLDLNNNLKQLENYINSNKSAINLQEYQEMEIQYFDGKFLEIIQCLQNISSCSIYLCDYQNSLDYSLSALQFLQIIEGDLSHIALGLNQAGISYYYLDDYQKGLKYLLESIEISKQIYQENDLHLADVKNNVGLCYLKLENKICLLYFLESLEIKKIFFQESNFHIALALNNVGQSYGMIGENELSLQYYLESLEMRQQTLKGIHPDIATSLNAVGLTYYMLGDYQNGLKYLLESLEMRKQTYQKNHPFIIHSLYNIGTCYGCVHDFQNMMKYMLEALERSRQFYETYHFDIAMALKVVGIFYQFHGEFQICLQYYLECLEIFEQYYKSNHSQIVTILKHIGQVYFNLYDKQNGLKYSLQYLEMQKQISQDPPDFEVLFRIGQYYYNVDENYNALKYFLEIEKMKLQNLQSPDIPNFFFYAGLNYVKIGNSEKEMKRSNLKGNHPSIADSLHAVGTQYIKRGDRQNGLRYLLEYLNMEKQLSSQKNSDIFEIQRQTSHETLENIAQSLDDVGLCYLILGQEYNCLNYFQESLEMHKKIKSPHLATVLNNLGNAYQQFHRYKISLKYFLESYVMQFSNFQRDQILAIRTLHNMGQCYLEIDNKEKSKKCFLKSLSFRRKVSKGNTFDLAVSLYFVGLFYKRYGEYENARKYFLESSLVSKQIIQQIKAEGNMSFLQDLFNNYEFCLKKLGMI